MRQPGRTKDNHVPTFNLLHRLFPIRGRRVCGRGKGWTRAAMTPVLCDDCQERRIAIVSNGKLYCWQCFMVRLTAEREAEKAKQVVTIAGNCPPFIHQPGGA